MEIDLEHVERMANEGEVTWLMIYLTPIAQEIDDWAEQNREYRALAASRLELLREAKVAIEHGYYSRILIERIEKELGDDND